MRTAIVTMAIILVLATVAAAQEEAPAAAVDQVEQQQGVEVQEIADGYLPLITDARLLRSGCKVREIPGKGNVLMAVGVIAVKPSQLAGQSLALAIAGAQANARAELTKFLYGVANETATEVHDMLEVKTFTREEASGIVRNAQQRGQWIAKDGTVLGVLLVLERGSARLANDFINDMKDFTSTTPDEAAAGADGTAKVGGDGIVGHTDPEYDFD